MQVTVYKKLLFTDNYKVGKPVNNWFFYFIITTVFVTAVFLYNHTIQAKEPVEQSTKMKLMNRLVLG